MFVSPYECPGHHVLGTTFVDCPGHHLRCCPGHHLWCCLGHHPCRLSWAPPLVSWAPALVLPWAPPLVLPWASPATYHFQRACRCHAPLSVQAASLLPPAARSDASIYAHAAREPSVSELALNLAPTKNSKGLLGTTPLRSPCWWYLLGGMLLQANDRPPNMRDSPVWNSVTHIRGLQLLGGPRIVSFGVRCGRKKRSSKPIRQPGAPSHPRIQCWTVLRIWVCGRREINAHFFPARRRHTEPNIESGGSGGDRGRFRRGADERFFRPHRDAIFVSAAYLGRGLFPTTHCPDLSLSHQQGDG